MAVPALPQEIIDRFVLELESDRVDLLPLLSVSRSFYYPARESIFRHLDITFYANRNPNERIALINELISDERTGILDITRTLTIHFSHAECKDGDFENRFSPHLLVGLKDETLPTFFRLMSTSRIHTLRLDGPAYIFHILDLGKVWLKDLVALRCNPNLRTLHFDNMRRIPRLLFAGNPVSDRVTEISLCSTWTASNRGIPYPWSIDERLPPGFDLSAPPLQHLETLIIDAPDQLHQTMYAKSRRRAKNFRLSPTSDFSLDFILPSLKKLVVGSEGTGNHWMWLDQGEQAALDAIVKRAPNLRSLHLGRQTSLDGNTFRLNNIPRLLELTFDCGVSNAEDVPFLGSAFTYLESLLKDEPLPPLRTVTFRFSLQIDNILSQYLSTEPALENNGTPFAVGFSNARMLFSPPEVFRALRELPSWETLIPQLRKIPSLQKFNVVISAWNYKLLNKGIQAYTISQAELSRMGDRGLVSEIENLSDRLRPGLGDVEVDVLLSAYRAVDAQ